MLNIYTNPFDANNSLVILQISDQFPHQSISYPCLKKDENSVQNHIQHPTAFVLFYKPAFPANNFRRKVSALPRWDTSDNSLRFSVYKNGSIFFHQMLSKKYDFGLIKYFKPNYKDKAIPFPPLLSYRLLRAPVVKVPGLMR
jgi:hypothetical protein